MDNVIPLRRQKTSEWLEALARKPFAYNRELLLHLAERCRAIEALDLHRDQGDQDGPRRGDLDLGEAA
jgi:hypothetical protein